MSAINKQEVGAITWADLTVPNAAAVKDFYRQVVGWKFASVAMGEYNAFNMNVPASSKTMAGICHARDANAALPAPR